MNDLSVNVKCLHPKRIVNPYTNESMVVPCGKCEACLSAKGSKLSLWCQLESACHKHTVFVTLTYANRFIPRASFVESDTRAFGYDLYDKDTGEFLEQADMTLDQIDSLKKKFYLFGDVPYLRKKDLQDFLKRLRYYAQKDCEQKGYSARIRYFACGEYGPVHYRPHFHLLLFIDDTEQLQALEENILKSWQFGRCDVQLAQGKAVTYVARYVNSFTNLPKIYRTRPLCPFALHSQRLGFKILQDSRKTVYESTVDSFIKRCLVVNAQCKDVFMWRSYYAYFYPKCRGFDEKSVLERTFSYRLYDKAREIFPECETVIDLARSTATLLNTFGLHFPRSFVDRYKNWKDQLDYFRYFDDPTSHCSDITSPVFEKWINRIYTELLLSKHFLYFVCDHRTVFEINKKISLITQFYDRLDYLHLTQFFEDQQQYFASNLNDSDSLVTDDFDNTFLPYFYNNYDYDISKYYNSRVYGVLSSKCIDRYESFIKHKTLNDMNSMFNF